MRLRELMKRIFKKGNNKYQNRKTEVDGILFDSKKEAQYYVYLKQQEQLGNIKDLQMQVSFELIPAVWKEETKQLKTKEKTVRRCVQRATKYVADFVYTDTQSGLTEVVDVKSKVTRDNKEYRLKKKMMFAFKGIEIIEV